MDEIERLERHLMEFPDDVGTQNALVSAYMNRRGWTREQASWWCLSVWHSYKQAAEVMHAVRLLAPNSTVRNQLERAMRTAADVKENQRMKAMIGSGSHAPIRIPWLDEYGAEKPDVCVLVGAAWLIKTTKELAPPPKPENRGRPPRRRW